MSDGVHILAAQRDPEARRRIAAALAVAGWRVTEAPTTPACLAALERDRDLVVLVDGLDGLAPLAEGHPDVPVLVVGADEVALATEAMQQGAWDYVVARPGDGHLDVLRGAIARAVGRRRLVRERNRLRSEMEGLAVALQRTTDGVAILGAGGRIAFANRALADGLAGPASPLVGRPLRDVVRVPGDDHGLDDILGAVAEQGRWSGELRGARGRGSVGRVADAARPPDGRRKPRRRPRVRRHLPRREREARPRAAARRLPLDGHPRHQGAADRDPRLHRDARRSRAAAGATSRSTSCRASGRAASRSTRWSRTSSISRGSRPAGFSIDPRPFDLRAMLGYALEQHAPRRGGRAIALDLDAEASADGGRGPSGRSSAWSRTCSPTRSSTRRAAGRIVVSATPR